MFQKTKKQAVARNLALLTQIIGKFEYFHRVDVFNGTYININTERLFNLYLRLLQLDFLA